MTAAVRKYVDGHFKNRGTLQELKNTDDPRRKPETQGQHYSISIVRLPLPATQDGLFVIKDLGNTLERPFGGITKGTDGDDIYPLEARDLWAEANVMAFLGTHTDIPVPWIYSSCAADEKDPQRSFFAMEYVEGRVFDTRMTLTEDQKNSIIKQVAAIRIKLIEITSRFIGGANWPILPGGTPAPTNPRDKHPAGAMSGPRLWDDGRHQIRNHKKVNHGPYSSIRDFVIASFQKEVTYYALNPKETAFPAGKGEPQKWQSYITGLTKKLKAREFSAETEFHLTHGDLVEGNNIAVRGGKIVAIIDWETAAFLPFSEAIADILPDNESALTDPSEIPKFMDPSQNIWDGMGRPTYRDWIDYREAELGSLGTMQAWPQLKGRRATIDPSRFTSSGDFSIEDFQDSDSEYSDGDEIPERVPGDWWMAVAVPAIWSLIERHISNYGINGVPYEASKFMWSDPVVSEIGLGNLNPQQRLFLA